MYSYLFLFIYNKIIGTIFFHVLHHHLYFVPSFLQYVYMFFFFKFNLHTNTHTHTHTQNTPEVGHTVGKRNPLPSWFVYVAAVPKQLALALMS